MSALQPSSSTVIKVRPAASPAPENVLVKINVGGRRFVTTKSTLVGGVSKENFFTGLLAGSIPTLKDEKDYYVIDRDGNYFGPILNYLRSGEWRCPRHLEPEVLLSEARFYSIEPNLFETVSDSSVGELLKQFELRAVETEYEKHADALDLVREKLLKEFLQQAQSGRRPEVVVFPSRDEILAHILEEMPSWGKHLEWSSTLGVGLQKLSQERGVLATESAATVFKHLTAFVGYLKSHHALTVRTASYKIGYRAVSVQRKSFADWEWFISPAGSFPPNVPSCPGIIFEWGA